MLADLQKLGPGFFRGYIFRFTKIYPLKCLFLIGSLKLGGAERSVCRLSNYLSDRGYEVHLILRERVVKFHLDEKVNVHVLSGWKHGSQLGKLLRFRKAMKSKIKEINPRVSVAYTSLNGVVLSSTLVKNGIVRFDVYPLTLKKWKRALFLSFLNLPNISRIICLTNDTKEDLLPYYPNKTLEVIPNAALPDRRRIAAQETTVSSELEHRPYIVSSGRLVRTKGFEVALRAYAKAGVHHQCDYVILGQGSLRERLVDLIEELGLQGHVHLLGYQSEPFPIVEKALCFVHASAREGFPNVLVEALSLGVPVIATNCKTGPSEIVQHGRNGFLTEMDDVEKISQYIHKIVSDPQLRLELSQYAPSSVDRFAEEKVFAQWENVLSKYDDK